MGNVICDWSGAVQWSEWQTLCPVHTVRPDPTRPDATKLFCRVATVGRCELGTLRHVLRVDAVCCDLAYKSGRN